METYCVVPGKAASLMPSDARERSEFEGTKQESLVPLAELQKELGDLQEKLWAQKQFSVLIVLQGMDTSGKDGTIRSIFAGISPQGVRVANFRRPSEEELNHHYLWRVQRQLPGRGEIVIFNRSHYEAVLAERVLDIAPKQIWSERFDQINSFESTLAAEGTVILKFFLHISRDEQRERLMDRRNDPDKQWKLGDDDVVSHRLWDDYTLAYEEMLGRTSTTAAPWYVIPSDRKWYRNLVISTLVVRKLQTLGLEYPPASVDLEQWSLD